MCGILGFITDETKYGEQARADFLKQGLIVDTVRGDDSTGVFGVAHDDKDETGPYWCKEAVAGHAFTQGDHFLDNFWDVSSYRAAVGHNRAATSGDRSTAGAHPFVCGPITLVHNGTLHHCNSLPTPIYEMEDITVDSHAIAQNLALHSVDDVVRELDGAFTLIWHDQRNDSMNIIRNDKRPLHMARGKSQHTIFFASEGEMLDFMCKRLSIGIGPIFYPKAGQHLQWLGDTELNSPIVKELELYTWGNTTHTTYSTGYGGSLGADEEWFADDWEDWRSTGAGSSAMRGKPNSVASRVANDNRIWTGGQLKDIPMLLQESMLDEDLVVEDRLAFSPKEKIVLSPSRAQVQGTLEDGTEAMITAMWRSEAEKMDRQWTVRPVGIFYKHDGKKIVLVRQVYASYTKPCDNSDGTFVPETDDNGEYKIYFGAYGLKYGVTEWMSWVAGGCEYCGTPIPKSDHMDIEWVHNESAPLCITCSDALEEDIPYV